MSITSINFALFLLVCFVFFYICPVKHRWKVLLLASVAFYAISGLKYLPFILFTSVTVWLGGRRMGKLYQKQDELVKASTDRKEKKEIKAEYKKRAKRTLMLVMIINIVLLCVIKFVKYFIDPVNSVIAMTGLPGEFTVEMIIVPLGVSYYTFSTVGYLLDVYWRRYEYEPNVFRFVLYAIYFPHIVQGPISRYNLLGQELKKELRWDYVRVAQGLQLMLWGFFKKMVIADRINVFVNNVYTGGTNTSGLVFFVAMLFDAVQIYTDFTGYMDIVTGASQIFGVQLERNFNHPFFSKNVSEFWRRWHMTMGGWFKDYVYYPITMSTWLKNLNKNTKGKLPDNGRKYLITAIPIMITWFLTGLWHGTGNTYVAWGIYYGTLITLSTIFTPGLQNLGRKLHMNMEAHSFDIYRMVKMFLTFCGGRLLTRPGTLERTVEILKVMVTNVEPWALWDGTLTKFGLSTHEIILEICCIGLLWWVSYHEETKEPVRESLAKSNLVFRWMLLLGLIFSVLLFGYYGPGFSAASFIYAAY